MIAVTLIPAVAPRNQSITGERQSSYRTPTYIDPDYVPWWQSPDQYPSIDLDEAEEHREQFGGSRVWGWALPFFVQDVIDLGFYLPNPYSLSAIYVNTRQDLVVENLRVAVGVDAPPAGPAVSLPAVTFSDASARNQTVQFKADAWSFPFMNVFLVGGYVDGKGGLDVNIDLDALFPDVGAGPGTVSGRAKPTYQGSTLGIGTNLAAGWENYFTVLSIACAYLDLDIVDSRVEAWNISPRIGFTHGLDRWGRRRHLRRLDLPQRRRRADRPSAQLFAASSVDTRRKGTGC
jgi:hypothetical protein